jgi:predicted N-acetyltransferase YhbS
MRKRKERERERDLEMVTEREKEVIGHIDIWSHSCKYYKVFVIFTNL